MDLWCRERSFSHCDRSRPIMSLSNFATKVLSPIVGQSEIKDAGDFYESDQEGSLRGTPVEQENPLGYNVDTVTAVYLVLSGVIGTGIFATPGSVLKSMGSVGASYVLWVSGFIVALFQVFVYIEYVTYFKQRSGGEVAYLEQAYPRPKFLMPTLFAAITLVFSYLNSSALAFGQFILNAAEVTPTTWKERGIGTGVLSAVVIGAAISTKWSLKVSNVLGFVKVVTLLFISISGLVVLGGHTRIKNSHANFQNAWEGTTTSGQAIANAIIKTSFSYGGFQYAFNVVGESKNPMRIYRYFVPGTMLLIFILYILVVTALFAGGGSVQAIKASNNLAATLFFKNTFGNESAVKALDSLVALSALGHLIAAVVSQSRALRECGRQGVLPFPKIWVQSKPFGTPIGPLFFVWLVNVIVMIAPPAGDAYNFIVDLGGFSGYIFNLILVIGLLLVRRQRKAKNLGYAGWKTPLPIIIITILFDLFVIAVSFVPPNNGTLIGSDVTFFYATYALVSIGVVGICILYYVLWSKVLPRVGGYQQRYFSYRLANGELGRTVIKVPNSELAEWDETHKPEDIADLGEESIDDFVKRGGTSFRQRANVIRVESKEVDSA
ncbi:amino acid permease-domain-containing protein [Lipomyces kononenkoae]|uniref:Amino acid permease-domain-containing protein n=1 Tax=Lipomyces kononenkoae TaxID=34357 RepID=A0ACC3SSG4_LIPKO